MDMIEWVTVTGIPVYLSLKIKLRAEEENPLQHLKGILDVMRDIINNNESLQKSLKLADSQEPIIDSISTRPKKVSSQMKAKKKPKRWKP